MCLCIITWPYLIYLCLCFHNSFNTIRGLNITDDVFTVNIFEMFFMILK